MKLRRSPPLLAVLAAAVLLTACFGDDEPLFPPVAVTLAHINDHHSQLDPFANTELQLGGVATQVDLGGFARVTAAFRRYDGRSDVIKLHAGDAITGSLYYTLFKGAADAALMNTVCFDAFAVGNHEFDDGDAGLRTFVDELHKGACKTPILSANIAPAAGTPMSGRIAPSTVKTVNGVRIGIVGLTIKGKTTNSSRPLASTVFEDEVTAAQTAIDALKRQEIRHIVLLSHQGYEADKAIAARLTDVDAIIGGDSHSLLGDFSAQGLSSSGPYPTRVVNKDGKTVCIGQAWEYAKAIGEMAIQFNDRGEVASCTGQASLLLGSSFKRKNAAGAWTTLPEADRQGLLASLSAAGNLKVMEPDTAAAAQLANFSGQVESRKAEVIGSAAEALCLVRVPGESTNRSAGVAGCEAANTLARGSDAAQVVAEAFLAGSLAADVAIQNAGGVRVALPAGPLSMNSAFTLLPFTNVLVELKLTGSQIAAVLEDAVANHLDNGQSNGSHPYAAGLRWSLDLSKPKGQRFSNLQVRSRTAGTWSALEPARTYTVATNDFIASGKDGYTTFGTVFAAGNYVNNYLLYSQTFVDYVKVRSTIRRPSAADYSHQSVRTAAGVTLP